MTARHGNNVHPLTALPRGAAGTIVGLGGGRQFQARLIGMGLHVGSSVQVLSSAQGGNGPTLVAAGETRLAIGHGMAHRIMVRTGGPAQSNA